MVKKYLVREDGFLKDFTDNVCAQASFFFRALLKEKEIRVNGERVTKNVPLKKGDEVCYYLSGERAQKSAFQRVYEDEHVIVVDKESGVNSEAVFSALSEEGNCCFLHRLDRNTQGLMVFAKDEETNAQLLSAFKNRRVVKVYHAVVLGVLQQKQGVLRAFLQKDSAGARVKISGKEGEPITTEYRVLCEKNNLSLLEVTLHTGKTHQIRAHFAYIGHPVAGDEKYGDEAENKRLHLKRQLLLSKKLTLYGEDELSYLSSLTFTSPRTLPFEEL